MVFLLVGANTALASPQQANMIVSPQSYVTITGGNSVIVDNGDGTINISGYTSTAYAVDAMWSSDFDVQNAGVAWTIADKYNSGNYTGDKGQGWIWMTAPPTSGSVYLRSKLVHTYNSGTISGVGISASGLSVTLSPEVVSWSAIGPFTTISSWPIE
ncbi:hypothetical protein [Desulfitobacterium sp.]|uniref:hypothetical protein n=1 Tax=Desulfitobacterium sp. TaxID=49981 RepID=UPI002C00939E|nr:hypothetical protein [Desulfitobacterium sp.]HVJ47728.1 hypothetical protein [Desulfitobacterium sp.]